MPHFTLIQYQPQTNTWDRVQHRIPKKDLRCCRKDCKKRTRLKTCSKCQLTTYCSKKCQKIHWKNGHSWQCSKYSWYPLTTSDYKTIWSN